jgi:hypothetical protein
VTRVALPFAVLLAVVAAGCGGNTVYTSAKTKTCLQQRGATIATPDRGDLVATTALGGAFKAELGDNSVTVAFGTNQTNGNDIYQAYQHFAFSNVKSGILDVLRRYNNVVTLWHLHPADADLSLVVGCLR